MSSPASASSNPFSARLLSELPSGQKYFNIQKLNDERIKQVRAEPDLLPRQTQQARSCRANGVLYVFVALTFSLFCGPSRCSSLSVCAQLPYSIKSVACACARLATAYAWSTQRACCEPPNAPPALSDQRACRLTPVCVVVLVCLCGEMIRVLLESAVRNADEFAITSADVEKIVDWVKTSKQQVEIPFKPARVLMQDFTGVPGQSQQQKQQHAGTEAADSQACLCFSLSLPLFSALAVYSLCSVRLCSRC